jgi:hypothetical protein
MNAVQALSNPSESPLHYEAPSAPPPAYGPIVIQAPAVFTDEDRRDFIGSLDKLLVYAIKIVKNKPKIRPSFSPSFSWKTMCTSFAKIAEFVRTETIPITKENILRFSPDQLRYLESDLGTSSKIVNTLREEGLHDAIATSDTPEQSTVLLSFLEGNHKKKIIDDFIKKLTQDIAACIGVEKTDVEHVKKQHLHPKALQKVQMISSYFRWIDNTQSLKFKIGFFSMFDIDTDRALLHLLMEDSEYPLRLVCEFLLAQSIKQCPITGMNMLLLFLKALEKKEQLPLKTKVFQIMHHYKLCVDAITSHPDQIDFLYGQFLEQISQADILFRTHERGTAFAKIFDPTPRGDTAKELAKAIVEQSRSFRVPVSPSQSSRESESTKPHQSQEPEGGFGNWW